MDKDLSLLLYKQMILPVFDYGDFLVDGAPEDNIEPLQTIQNHCLRCVLNIYDPIETSRVFNCTTTANVRYYLIKGIETC